MQISTSFLPIKFASDIGLTSLEEFGGINDKKSDKIVSSQRKVKKFNFKIKILKSRFTYNCIFFIPIHSNI